jgi:hypothetical protein
MIAEGVREDKSFAGAESEDGGVSDGGNRSANAVADLRSWVGRNKSKIAGADAGVPRLVGVKNLSAIEEDEENEVDGGFD